MRTGTDACRGTVLGFSSENPAVKTMTMDDASIASVYLVRLRWRDLGCVHAARLESVGIRWHEESTTAPRWAR